MSTHVTRPLHFLLTALTAAACHSAEPLRWKFEPGETLNYEMTQTMETTVAAGPAGDFTSGMKQIMDMKWHVDEVTPEGNAKMRQQIERVRLTMTMPGQVTEYDSAGDEPPQGMVAMLAPLYDAMTSGEFTVTMTPRGEIVDAEVPPKLMEAMKNVPGADALGDLSTSEGMKQLLTHSALTLPEGELQSGETWQSRVETKMPFGKMEVVTTYEYVGTKDADGQTFEVIKLSPEIKNAGDDGAQMQLDVSEQKSDGEILFDRELGQMHSSHLQQTMQMEMKVLGQKQAITIDQTVDMKLKAEVKSE
jgi:hypothetical protein